MLSYARILPPSEPAGYEQHPPLRDIKSKLERMFVRVRFPMDLVTAPLIADLFLLAILAIGREEFHDGTVGADSIHPVSSIRFICST